MVKDTCEDADAFLSLDISSGWQLKDESEIKSTPEGLLYQYVTYKKVIADLG